MSDPKPPALPPVLDRLAALRGYLTAVEDSLKLGVMPDMQGLDHRIADLCRDIELAEGGLRDKCLTELNAVMQSLDACRAGLVAWKEKGAGDD